MNGDGMIDGDSIRADAEAIYRERVLRARATSPDDKLVDGFRLFERACGLMRDGIRHQFPNAGPIQVEEILQRRLDIVRRMQDGDLYQPCLDDEA
jgi:hypothetical protein